MKLKQMPARKPKCLKEKRGVIIRAKEIIFKCKAGELNKKLLEYYLSMASINQ